jgi:hypothetical protein
MVTVVAMCAGAGIMIGNRKEAKADPGEKFTLVKTLRDDWKSISPSIK